MKKLFKKIYKYIPFKRELFSLLRIIWTPNEKIYKHLHFVGVFTAHINSKKSFKIKHFGYQIENEIFWSGLSNGWEKESTNLWIKLCENAEIVFDIGANTGVYALIAKAVNPKAKVYAFEPVSRVYDKLKENISLNNFDIVPIEKAVSDADGTAIIYDTSSEHIYSVTVNKNLATPETKVVEVKIDTITLNSFIRENAIKKMDLIKIDVETHEPEVLKGFSQYISQFRPSILIEILNNEVGQKVNAIVKGLDYLFFNIDERGGIRLVDTITKSDYYNYLLCTADVAVKLGLM